MGRLYDLLMKDYRLKEGLNACINCGTCMATVSYTHLTLPTILLV